MRQQQQTDVDLGSVQRCLDVIEADCQLSEAGVEAVMQAKQLINSCLLAASDAASSWTSLQSQSDMTDIHVCVYFFSYQSSTDSDNIDK